MLYLLMVTMFIGAISGAKQFEKTCKLSSLVAYMDEGCTIPYRSKQALEQAQEEVDRFNEAALYATSQCYNFTGGIGSIIINCNEDGFTSQRFSDLYCTVPIVNTQPAVGKFKQDTSQMVYKWDSCVLFDEHADIYGKMENAIHIGLTTATIALLTISSVL